MDFKEIAGYTRKLGQPEDWDQETHGDCKTLPVMDTETETGHPVMISEWVFTMEERQAIAQGGTLRLHVWGTGHPPVAMEVIPPNTGPYRVS